MSTCLTDWSCLDIRYHYHYIISSQEWVDVFESGIAAVCVWLVWAWCVDVHGLGRAVQVSSHITWYYFKDRHPVNPNKTRYHESVECQYVVCFKISKLNSKFRGPLTTYVLCQKYCLCSKSFSSMGNPMLQATVVRSFIALFVPWICIPYARRGIVISSRE